MKKMMIFLGMLILALVYSPLHADKAYGYTLKNLDTYIDNSDFHDNQDGRVSINLGISPLAGKSYATVNVNNIYLDSKHKTFQILARQYDAKKKINLTSKDMKWSVIDERICTIDSNGKVTAGNMTGVTIVIMEEKARYVVIPVVNITGKYDSWYENMFKDIETYNRTFIKDDFESAEEAKAGCEYMGNAYKVIIDAYLTYGEALRTDTEVKLKVISDASYMAFHLTWLVDNKGFYWSDGLSVTTIMTSYILELFTSKESKCGWSRVSGCNVLLMDGIIYEIDGREVEKLADESDWIWKDGALYGSFRYDYIIFAIETFQLKAMHDVVKTSIGFDKRGSFTDDRDYMANSLKNGVD